MTILLGGCGFQEQDARSKLIKKMLTMLLAMEDRKAGNKLFTLTSGINNIKRKQRSQHRFGIQ